MPKTKPDTNRKFPFLLLQFGHAYEINSSVIALVLFQNVYAYTDTVTLGFQCQQILKLAVNMKLSVECRTD